MLTFIDQLNRTIRLENYPKRIVSLVPSQTELLFDLGLENEVVGITKFCIHPYEWFRNKTRVGGTKKVNFKQIEKLQPDLIIANKEENTKEDIEQLAKIYPVWISDIYTLNDALSMIESIGKLTQTETKANSILLQIQNEFKTLAQINKSQKTVAYFIWNKPYMCAAKNTFINNILDYCGFKNVFSHSTERYPVTSEQELKNLNPDLVFLSSEPFPFKQKHIDELQKILPKSNVQIVDGELFSWYGSRLMQGPKYFSQILKNLP